MTTKQIDFTPLEQLVATTPSSTSLKRIILIIFVMPPVLMTFFALLVYIASESVVLLMVVLFGIVALILFAILRFVASQKRKELAKNEAIQSFATINGFTNEQGVVVGDELGSLFHDGHSKNIKQVITGKLANFPFRSFEYYYRVGHGKSERSYDAMVLEVTLPRVLPHFVIDSQIETVLPIIFDKEQKIELEGDFHKYFDLYAPDTYAVSALTLLAPDVMEVVMERAALCDIEIVQNKMYFYWQTPATTQQQYEQLFMTADAVLRRLGDKLSKDNIYGTASQAAVHARADSAGIRLKRPQFRLAASIGLIYILLIQTGKVLNIEVIENYNSVIIVVFILFMMATTVYTITKQESLRKSYVARYEKHKKD